MYWAILKKYCDKIRSLVLALGIYHNPLTRLLIVWHTFIKYVFYLLLSFHQCALGMGPVTQIGWGCWPKLQSALNCLLAKTSSAMRELQSWIRFPLYFSHYLMIYFIKKYFSNLKIYFLDVSFEIQKIQPSRSSGNLNTNELSRPPPSRQSRSRSGSPTPRVALSLLTPLPHLVLARTHNFMQRCSQSFKCISEQ